MSLPKTIWIWYAICAFKKYFVGLQLCSFLLHAKAVCCQIVAYFLIPNVFIYSILYITLFVYAVFIIMALADPSEYENDSFFLATSALGTIFSIILFFIPAYYCLCLFSTACVKAWLCSNAIYALYWPAKLAYSWTMYKMHTAALILLLLAATLWLFYRFSVVYPVFVAGHLTDAANLIGVFIFSSVFILLGAVFYECCFFNMLLTGLNGALCSFGHYAALKTLLSWSVSALVLNKALLVILFVPSICITVVVYFVAAYDVIPMLKPYWVKFTKWAVDFVKDGMRDF